MSDKILIPQSSYRFRVLFSDPTVNTESITQQIEKCELSYVDKTCNIIVIQPETEPKLHSHINRLCESNSTDIIVEHLNSQGNVSHVVVLNNSKVTSHCYELAYGNNSYATHRLEILCSRIEYRGVGSESVCD